MNKLKVGDKKYSNRINVLLEARSVPQPCQARAQWQLRQRGYPEKN
jgi:hypothetical protein